LNFLALGTIDSASTEFINLENKRLVYLILLVTSLIGIGFGMMVASIFEFSLLSLINQTKNL
jgi:hypothetical protein